MAQDITLYKEQRTFERDRQRRRKPLDRVIVRVCSDTRKREAHFRRLLRLDNQRDIWGDVEYRGPSFGLEGMYDDVESNLDTPVLVGVGAQEERVTLRLDELLPLISKPAKRKRRTASQGLARDFIWVPCVSGSDIESENEWEVISECAI